MLLRAEHQPLHLDQLLLRLLRTYLLPDHSSQCVAVGTLPVEAASNNISSSASKQALLTAAQRSRARALVIRTSAERVQGMAAQLEALKKV